MRTTSVLSYENGSIDDRCKEIIKEEYANHLGRKQDVRELKQSLKELAQERNDTVAVTFDMEAVLNCPQLNVSSLYRRHKLSNSVT